MIERLWNWFRNRPVSHDESESIEVSPVIYDRRERDLRDDDVQQRLVDLYAPSHRESQFVRILPSEADTSFEAASEVWERVDNSMQVSVTKGHVRTASDALVPVDALAALCVICQRWEDCEIRCRRCGHAVCRLHAQALYEHGVMAVYCPVHFQMTVEAYNTWIDVDEGRSAGPSGPYAWL